MSKELAKILAKKSKGNIKSKHLTDDGNIVQTYLYSGPIIQYIDDNEQPEFILSSDQYGFEITDEKGKKNKPHHTNSGGKTYLLLTDQRILYIAGLREGDELTEFNYNDIETAEVKEGKVHFSTKENKKYKYIHQHGKSKTVNSAVEYISNRVVNENSTVDTDKKLEFDAESEDTPEVVSRLSNINISNIINNDIPQRILVIDDSIKKNETVHYAYSINAAERGDDHMGGLTTGGCLLATDRRLTAHVNETIGSSNLSIDYKKIDTVEVEHGAVVTKLSVQSTSKTYSFPGFNNIDKSEIHDFADFIRDQASESKPNDTSGSNADPTEQLKNIKELHDQGVLTDEEFENKKQSLLDKL